VDTGKGSLFYVLCKENGVRSVALTFRFFSCTGIFRFEVGYLTALSVSELYRISLEERSLFWEVIVLVILSKNMFTYMCPISNGFRDRAISLYGSEIVGKKEILCIASNSGIYCSSDKVDKFT
jgi:hypothetical protein